VFLPEAYAGISKGGSLSLKGGGGWRAGCGSGGWGVAGGVTRRQPPEAKGGSMGECPPSAEENLQF